MLFTAILFSILLGSAYFAACCSLGFWLAFGKWHIAARTFVFLVGAYLLGARVSAFFRTPLTGPVIIGTTIIASSTAALRWLDFRWLSLTREVGREELDRVTYQIMVLIIVVQIFFTGLLTALVLSIIRQKGYRLVPVCRTASNVFTPQTTSAGTC